MGDSAVFLITLGAVLLLGLATEALGRLTRLPRVTLLLLFGILIGPEVLDLLPVRRDRWLPVTASIALVMVGFLLGERFTPRMLREHGREVLWISAAAVGVTALVVALGLLLAGAPLEIALLLAAISTSTAPAATVDVVDQEETETEFSRVLLGVVAVDDAWGLMLFTLVLALVGTLMAGDGAGAMLLHGAWEVGGAVLLGVALGLPLAFLTGRIRPGEPTLLEALGVVFLCGGVGIALGVSPLLAAMVLGATVANWARHHTRPFHAIEGIERPFLVLFFVFAGMSLEIAVLPTIGILGAAYVASRALGRVLGGFVGGTLAGAAPTLRRWIGLALMPQAGVALGLALLAADRLPDLGRTVLPLVIGTTVVFELLGPPCTRWALRSAGDDRLDRVAS